MRAEGQENGDEVARLLAELKEKKTGFEEALSDRKSRLDDVWVTSMKFNNLYINASDRVEQVKEGLDSTRFCVCHETGDIQSKIDRLQVRHAGIAL